jgi:hypothetical protein
MTRQTPQQTLARPHSDFNIVVTFSSNLGEIRRSLSKLQRSFQRSVLLPTNHKI